MSKNKKINFILYIVNALNKEGIVADFHKVFKILYFAEKKHLHRYGVPLSNEIYIAMDNGPVPSEIYDILKKKGLEFKDFDKYFSIEGKYTLKALKAPDPEEFSESETEVLNESIKENKKLSFSELKNKSHDSAWKSTEGNKRMDYKDIALAAGVDIESIDYILCMIDNEKIAESLS